VAESRHLFKGTAPAVLNLDSFDSLASSNSCSISHQLTITSRLVRPDLLPQSTDLGVWGSEVLVMLPTAATATATSPPSLSSLLHYLPAQRVLICKECRYAIQPSAISRHLKDLHHIYRSDRQELVEYANGLQLADPCDVVLPPPHEAPVPLLPTENGLACAREGCTHLCVTVKRMKNHWATAHKDVVGSGCSQWRPVTLQTFFRGNQLRYFIVSPQLAPESPSTQNSETQSEPDSRLSETTPRSDCSEPCLQPSELKIPSDWSSEDIALFNHFTEFTYYDMGRGPTSRRIWQAPIPEMAFRHDFLKHGILACAALHLAYLNPPERRRYQMIAACHQARGLPRFRTLIGAPTDETCNAILAFSHLLIVHCFAAEEQDETLLLVKEGEEPALPDWLKVIRGSCTMFEHVWVNMKNGLMKPLIEESLLEEPLPIIPENPEHSARLKQLLTLPIFSKEVPVMEILNHQVTAYSSALILLARAFGIAQAAKDQGLFTMWTAVQCWPARISLEFLDLLRAKEPAALVLLGHYCILLGPLEESWYMSGFRKRLLERVYWQLDEEWRTWLDWPFAECGLKPPGRTENTQYGSMDVSG
jgi:Orsellinic acid/F9775 biosynthesis cluster protein D